MFFFFSYKILFRYESVIYWLLVHNRYNTTVFSNCFYSIKKKEFSAAVSPWHSWVSLLFSDTFRNLVYFRVLLSKGSNSTTFANCILECKARQSTLILWNFAVFLNRQNRQFVPIVNSFLFFFNSFNFFLYLQICLTFNFLSIFATFAILPISSILSNSSTLIIYIFFNFVHFVLPNWL